MNIGDAMKESLKIIPTHLGLIIDGNGRWAKARGLSRSMGHKAGFKRLKEIVKECFYTYNIKYVSVYAFSTENWNRPQKEVDYLMKIFHEYLEDDFLNEFPNVKLNIMGDLTPFDDDLKKKAISLMEKTKDNDFVLNLGINYSGQDELVMAVNKIIAEKIDKVDRSVIDSHLYTSNQPPLDFLIRTSGEMRVSNFMLWQMSYAEFYFPETHWPDFNKKELYKALKEFEGRNRRFGAIKE